MHATPAALRHPSLQPGPTTAITTPDSHYERGHVGGGVIIARVEATALGTDVRYVVTNLTGRGKHLYEHVYCARGRMENLIRLAAPRRSRWRGATFETIRTTFVKIACRVEELKRSIKLSFASALPQADTLALITAQLTARGS
jgi:hypothetical protein